MKHLKLVSLLLAMLLFITGCSENNKEEQTTFEETSLVTTELTTTQEVIEEQNQTSETLTEKQMEKLFADDMVVNLDGYNTVEFTTNNIKYSAKIPEHWYSEEFSCEEWIENWGDYPQHCGLKLFSREIPKKRYLDDGTFYIAESISSLYTPTPTIESDFAIQQSLTTQTGLEMDIYLEKAEPHKFSDCDGYTGLIIINNKQSMCIFVEIFKDDDVQELFNVLNSIEITKLEEDN